MKKWSKKYDFCIDCKTAEIKHKGNGYCKICYEKNRDINLEIKRIKQREYRAKYPNKVRESQRLSKLKTKNEIHLMLGGECIKCGFSDTRALQIDHIKGGGYKERKGYNTNPKEYYRNILKSIKNKENKYQLLCANCNWIKRFENNEIRRK